MTDVPLRLAFILPHFHPGGAERVVLNLLRQLDRGRFAPHLFLARAEGAFLDKVPADVPVTTLGERRARHLPGAIRRALRANRIEAAYAATNAVNLALLASAVGGKASALRIVSEHTSPAPYLAEAKHRRLRRLLMRHLYPRAAAIAVPTEGIAAELKAALARPDLPTLVLPNPVTDRIAARKPAPDGARPRLVAAGRLVPAKGFDLLIEAAAMLDARGLDFELAIFGDGPERDYLADLIGQLELGGKVRLAGATAELERELARADLFVLSSRREGFGNVIVEAMAAGAPVLATACDGPRSLIRDGENGFLAPPDSAAGLAAVLEKLLRSPHRRAAVVAAAAETARGYEVAAATAAFERALLDLVGGKLRSRQARDQDR
ncbi:MAG TPA: glycosyltransferase [Allosphingosinicella sp.]|nr:glycosyltransferase [Allosphingosinicella sp.]